MKNHDSTYAKCTLQHFIWRIIIIALISCKSEYTCALTFLPVEMEGNAFFKLTVLSDRLLILTHCFKEWLGTHPEISWWGRSSCRKRDDQSAIAAKLHGACRPILGCSWQHQSACIQPRLMHFNSLPCWNAVLESVHVWCNSLSALPMQLCHVSYSFVFLGAQHLKSVLMLFRQNHFSWSFGMQFIAPRLFTTINNDHPVGLQMSWRMPRFSSSFFWRPSPRMRFIHKPLFRHFLPPCDTNDVLGCSINSENELFSTYKRLFPCTMDCLPW